jgi:hypothetical protein
VERERYNRDRDNRDHLRRILAVYTAYYNGFRTHLSLAKDSPGIGQSNGTVSLPPCRSLVDFITNTAGYSFR